MLSQTPTNAPTNKSSRKALAAPKKRTGEKIVHEKGSKIAKSLEKEFDSCDCVRDREEDDSTEDVDIVKKGTVTNEEIAKAIAKVMGKNATEQETVEKSSVETVEIVETSANEAVETSSLETSTLETSSDESIKTDPNEAVETSSLETSTLETSSDESIKNDPNETVETSALETSSDESIKTDPTEIKDTTTTLDDVSKCVT
jgi:hypothetical protein